jgi:23S rRNA pseudouridine2605 synthase
VGPLRVNGSPVHILAHQIAVPATGTVATAIAHCPARDRLDGPAQHGLISLGRLPRTDAGLVLLTNDTLWAARVAPEVRRLLRVYQVQIGRIVDVSFTARLVRGVTDQGDFLAATTARPLDRERDDRWLELGLREAGRLSPRRLIQAFGIEVLQVRRVGLGPLQLGDLPPGHHRLLTATELTTLGG